MQVAISVWPGYCVGSNMLGVPSIRRRRYAASKSLVLRLKTNSGFRLLCGRCRPGETCSIQGSHDLLPHQLPVCSFFLRLCCDRDDCPLLHVKHSDMLPPCRYFLAGKCQNGAQVKRISASLLCAGGMAAMKKSGQGWTTHSPILVRTASVRVISI